MQGRIFDIQKFCVNDGPGIRTTVFLKGCPLRCVWCHNPESQKREKQLLFYADKCTGCGRCKNADFESGDFFCYNSARELCGRDVTVDEVMREVMKDVDFYRNSNGGMTLSGGEPLAQPEFALELLKRAKENGLHTAIETCGFASADTLERIAEYVDLFLFDIKETDPERHREYTGVDLAPILDNLRLINRLGKPTVLRCPIIPSYNDREEHYLGIVSLAECLESVIGVDIEPYHAFGGGKYKALGLDEPDIRMPTDEEIETIISFIQSKTEKKVSKA